MCNYSNMCWISLIILNTTCFMSSCTNTNCCNSLCLYWDDCPLLRTAHIQLLTMWLVSVSFIKSLLSITEPSWTRAGGVHAEKSHCCRDPNPLWRACLKLFPLGSSTACLSSRSSGVTTHSYKTVMCWAGRALSSINPRPPRERSAQLGRL